MQVLILDQPIKGNFVSNNQQKLVFLEASVLDYESSTFRYKEHTAVLKSGKRLEQPKIKDTCSFFNLDIARESRRYSRGLHRSR